MSQRHTRVLSLALQHSPKPGKMGDLLAGANCAPCGPIVWHDRLTQFASVPDLIGRLN